MRPRSGTKYCFDIPAHASKFCCTCRLFSFSHLSSHVGHNVISLALVWRVCSSPVHKIADLKVLVSCLVSWNLLSDDIVDAVFCIYTISFWLVLALPNISELQTLCCELDRLSTLYVQVMQPVCAAHEGRPSVGCMNWSHGLQIQHAQ